MTESSIVNLLGKTAFFTALLKEKNILFKTSCSINMKI